MREKNRLAWWDRGCLWLFLWGATLLGTCGRMWGQAPITTVTHDTLHVFYAPALSHQWALLFREFETEWEGCLYGELRLPDSLFVPIMILSDVRPSESTTNSVSALGPCPGKPVGYVHSHPQSTVCMIQGGGCIPHYDPTLFYCEPSPLDLKTFLESSYTVSVIVCGYGKFITVFRDSSIAMCEYDPEKDEPHCR